MNSLRYIVACATLASLTYVGAANATTRAQVVAAGPAYTGYSWTCNQRNLLDTDGDGVDERPNYPFAAGGPSVGGR